jgi:hypothetical protein
VVVILQSNGVLMLLLKCVVMIESAVVVRMRMTDVEFENVAQRSKFTRQLEERPQIRACTSRPL